MRTPSQLLPRIIIAFGIRSARNDVLGRAHQICAVFLAGPSDVPRVLSGANHTCISSLAGEISELTAKTSFGMAGSATAASSILFGQTASEEFAGGCRERGSLHDLARCPVPPCRRASASAVRPCCRASARVHLVLVRPRAAIRLAPTCQGDKCSTWRSVPGPTIIMSETKKPNEKSSESAATSLRGR